MANALQNNCVAHAYLFYGQESVGKKRLALSLAKVLNCKGTIPFDSCDKCDSCLKTERFLHPDLFLIRPVKNTTTAREAAIKVETIRELQKKLTYMPYGGGKKVVIIESAELMNLQASNAFLKTLEEPPENTVLILISSNPHRLLPTIISRCQGILFHSLSISNVKEIVNNQLKESESTITESELNFRIQRSEGSISNVLAEDFKELEVIREQALEVLENVSFDRMDIIFGFAKSWSKQTEQLQLVLKEFSELIREMALHRSGCISTSYSDSPSSRISKIAQTRSLNAWLEQFSAVRKAQIALSGNANTQLSLENMLIEFCEAA